MKNIIKKFKKMFTSQEVKDFTSEVLSSAEKIKEEAVKKVDTVKAKAAAVGEILTSDDIISFDDFLKIQVKVGTILQVEEIPKSEKLYVLTVDLGERKPRQIVSGIKQYYPQAKKLVNRQAVFVANLEPKEVMGYTSQGMILGLKDKEHFSILGPDMEIAPGTKAS